MPPVAASHAIAARNSHSLPEALLEILLPRTSQPVARDVPAPGSSSAMSALRLPIARAFTFSVPEPPSRVVLRQTVETSTIPSTYGALNSGPDPGTVVGITLGAVGGFIVFLWLVYTCINLGNPEVGDSVGTASVVTYKSRRSHHHHHHHRSPRRETVEIRTSTRGPIIVEEAPAERVERVVVQERTRSVSRGVPPPPRVVSDDEDEIVVLEEHSPPRRHRSKSTRRSAERRSSGYRDIDPDRFAGGDGPVREVRRASGSRRG